MLFWVRVAFAIVIIGLLIYLFTVFKFTLRVAELADEQDAGPSLTRAADRLVTATTAAVIAFASAFAAVLPAAVLGLKRRDAFGGVLAGSAALVSIVDTGNRAWQESLTYVSVALLGLSVVVIVAGTALERWKLRVALRAEESMPGGVEARRARESAVKSFDDLVKKTALPIPLAVRYLGLPIAVGLAFIVGLVSGAGQTY